MLQLSAFDWNSNIESNFFVQLKQVQSVKIKSKLNIKTNFHRTFVIPWHTEHMLRLLLKNHAYDKLVRNCLLFHSLKIHVHISFAHMKLSEVSLKLQLYCIKLLQPRRRGRIGEFISQYISYIFILIHMCRPY